jgi:DnaD/phage-associated family protein
MKASHENRKFLFNGKEIWLNSGEFVTGRDAITFEMNKGVKREHQVNSGSVWRWLKRFEKEGMLNIKSTTKYSVVSINNWDDYQASEHQVNIKRTTSEQQVHTNKNEKNDKNEKNINNNNKGSSIRSIWENNGFGLMSSKTMTDFDYWISDFEKIGASQKDAEQLIVKAIEIAIDANARNYNYINAILKDWEQRGFKSVDEREAARKQKKTTKQQKSNTGHLDYDDLGF